MEVSDLAGSIEQLLANLNRPSALAKAVRVREKAAALIPEWGHARFENERLFIERLLDAGQLQPAYERAQSLLEKARTVGPQAYPGADYHLALAHILLGRILRMGGQAAPALNVLIESQRLSEDLGERGAHLASASLSEQADCLRYLGRLNDAAKKNEEAIERDQKAGRFRDAAVGKGQLATVRRMQEKYAEAIAVFKEAIDIFEMQNEPRMVAVGWHQIGNVYFVASDHEEAEAAYRRSLEMPTLRTVSRVDMPIRLGDE